MILIQSRKRSKYTPTGSHTKYINSNGDYVPSVTSILKVIPKDALIYWANSLGWKRKSARKELEIAANVGTRVHNEIEKIIRHDKSRAAQKLGLFNIDALEKEINDYYINDEVRNSLLSFLEWYKDHREDIELVDMEKEMSGDSYGGTCDMICRYKGKLMIFDFKTSGDFYFSMFLQLAAYVKLYEKETGEKIEDVAVLRMDKKNGNRAKLKKLSDIKNASIEYYYFVFEQCCNLHRSLYVLENDWKG